MGGVFDGLGGLRGGVCRYGVPVETCLGDLWGLLWIHGYFFGHLGGWCFWEPLGVIWELLGGLWLLFLCFFVGKRETVKSVVLLKEIDVLRGGGGAGWSYFSYFLPYGGVWKLLHCYKAYILKLFGKWKQ